MADTFNTSRVGGGTYELEQDSSGNYNLKSVGFKKVNKLNLPDLTNLDAPKATTTPVKKPDVADPFKKLADQNQGGGDGGNNIYQDYDRIKPKDISVKEAGVRQTLDPRDDRSPTDIQNLQNAQQDYRDASIAYRSDSGSSADKAKMDAANETIMDARQNYGATTQYNTPKTTGLQQIKGAVTNTVKNILDNSLTVKVAKGAGSILKGAATSLTGKDQTDLNNANKNALTSLGYKTNYELGNMNDPGRIAGNPANNVFAGMNAVSAFGDISKGASKRIGTIEKTISKMTPAQKKKSSLPARLETFKKQKDDHDQAAAKDKANAQAAKDNRAKDKQGNTMGGSCFIAGTKVTMSDGTLKNIENIVVGDKVKGHKEDNTVIKLDPTLLADRKLYSFNDNEHYFFTSEHPFMTEEGWKSIKPEKTKERDGIELYNQLKGELKIGDKLITEDGTIEIKNIKSKEINNPDMPLYNFNVSNDNSYVADKYIVHNKGGGGGRVICTDLHRTGELSTRDWVRDTKFTFKTLSKTHVKGYLLWAEPTVKHMQKYPRYRKMWKHIAQHRANDIAWRLNEGKFDLLGRIYAGIGEPVCWALGNFVSDKQISKYNLTHWRRA